MEVNRLSGDELAYELIIRGCAVGSNVAEKRVQLRQALREEVEPPSSIPESARGLIDLPGELQVCKAKLEQLTEEIKDFNATNSENEYRRLKTKLTHVRNRVLRIEPSDQQPESKVDAIITIAEGSLEALEDVYAKADAQARTTSILDEPNLLLPEVAHESHSSTCVGVGNLIDLPCGSSQAPPGIPPSTPDVVAKSLTNLSSRLRELSTTPEAHHVPSGVLENNLSSSLNRGNFCQHDQLSLGYSQTRGLGNTGYIFRGLNIFFDGHGSLTTFLEDLEDKATARGVQPDQLLQYAVEFLKADALLWFRTRRQNFRTWSDLKNGLRAAFLPMDYEYDLMEEIRRRTQGPDERLIIYVACMQSLFNRLSRRVPELEQVGIIRRNLLPHLVTGLTFCEVESVDDLLKYGRAIEETHWRASKYVPPSSMVKGLQEPGLAYRRTDRVRTSAVNGGQSGSQPSPGDVICWRCRQPGHYRGQCKAVKCELHDTYTCKTCQGNASPSH